MSAWQAQSASMALEGTVLASSFFHFFTQSCTSGTTAAPQLESGRVFRVGFGFGSGSGRVRAEFGFIFCSSRNVLRISLEEIGKSGQNRVLFHLSGSGRVSDNRDRVRVGLWCTARSWCTARNICFNKSFKRNCIISSSTGIPNLGVWCKKWSSWTKKSVSDSQCCQESDSTQKPPTSSDSATLFFTLLALSLLPKND